jgi:hypothetical protein
VGETLLLIDVVNAYGLVILQTSWAMTADLRGRRLTRTETIRDQAQLARRLAELTPLLGGHLPLAEAAA